jgi:Kef-type K+ transport system membrane component KefB
MFEIVSQFQQLAAVMLIAALLGAVGKMLRQPLIIAFIVVGILVGPTWLGIIHPAQEVWELLATTGLALLLFLVGLKLDFQVIRSNGMVALATGLGQVIFTSIIGFGLALLLGMDPLVAVYVAVALTFSSTIVIVKLLSDKREIETLHGRVAIGLLIVQDILVVLVMIGLSAYGAGENDGHMVRDMLLVLGRGLVLLAVLAILMRYALPWLFGLMARSQELLVLAAIAWALLLAAVGDLMGLSKEVGAFLAGVSLASTPVRESIASRLVSVRDFLLLFFFLVLGADLDLSIIGDQILPAVVLSVFVLVGNPFIVMVIMRFMGYRRRTGFLTGLTVAQISEFSLIFGALGLSLGHITSETMGLITLVGIITIGISTYMILYSIPIYHRIGRWLAPFEAGAPFRDDREPGKTAQPPDIVVFGLGRYGGQMAEGFQRRGLRVLGVDFDPRVVRAQRQTGIDARYGDAEDPEFPHSLPLEGARWIVSTIPFRDVNRVLLRSLRAQGYDGKIAVPSHNNVDDGSLLAAGADRVLLPFTAAAGQAVETILQDIDHRPAAPAPAPGGDA